MVIEIPCARAADALESLCERVADGALAIVRRDGGDVALLAGRELSELVAALDLLRAPGNAAPLLASFHRVRERAVDPGSLTALRRALRTGAP